MINFICMLLSNNAEQINIDVVANRSLFSIYAALFVYLYSSFNEMIAIYSLFIIIDYILGMILAKRNDKFSWSKGIKGAINKVLGFSVIIVAMLLDYLVICLSTRYNIEFNMNYISVITAIFLTVNEGYSILRNWKELGIEVPFYLKGIFDFLKKIRINKK